MKKKKLVIISHTQHYKAKDGVVLGWGSTINEVNFLADYWEEVVHVACLHDTKAPPSSLPYTKSNITFVAIPPYGGKRIIDKILIFTKIPIIIFQVIKAIKNASEVQLRLPTSMGLFLLPLFSFFICRRFTFWVKYAGNWNEENPPLSYSIQRFWLKKNWANCKVTINGFWKNQPSHCFSFENPCLTLDDIDTGKRIGAEKIFNSPFVLTFVGRLESAKGVDRILQALQSLPTNTIATVHFIGDGEKMNYYKNQATFLKYNVFFHGFLGTKDVHKILQQSHFLLLPSTASEGFPKVIAEAACYGVLPIVSDVGSIAHYVNEENGFLWRLNTSETFPNILKDVLHLDNEKLKSKSINAHELAEKFTFVNYFHKLEKFIFS